MHILYVEDNLANVALIDRMIRMSGDSMDTFTTAEAALDNADLATYDVIITDIHLGENVMDGLDFAAAVRDQGITAPIIAITAYDFEEYERRSAEVGSDMYIVKPIPPQQFVELLNRFRN